MKVSKSGNIINNNGACSINCDWLIIFNTEPRINLIRDSHFCSLFNVMLKQSLHGGNIKSCDECQKLAAENLPAPAVDNDSAGAE